MRKQMYAVLEQTFGPASRSREGCDWWIVKRGGVQRDVHICLNSPHADVAHILIFDPDPANEQFITDVSARSQAEAMAIIEQLRYLIPPRGKAGLDGRDGHEGHAGGR